MLAFSSCARFFMKALEYASQIISSLEFISRMMYLLKQDGNFALDEDYNLAKSIDATINLERKSPGSLISQAALHANMLTCYNWNLTVLREAGS